MLISKIIFLKNIYKLRSHHDIDSLTNSLGFSIKARQRYLKK
jgi:hypothetical protein